MLFSASLSWILTFSTGLVIIILGLIVPGQVSAVTASPEPVVALQPDGSVLKIFLVGDEYLHWNTDETGYPVVPSGDGKSWVYARQELGRLVPTS